MRIGIDARELCGRPTGVGRYLSGLLHQWSGNRALRHEFVLYSHEPLRLTLDPQRFSCRVIPGKGGTLWEQRGLPAAMALDHPDVLFAPAYTAPLLARIPIVVAIHDASFAAHPEWFTAREGLRRRVLSRRAAAAARAVITISEFSRGELVNLLRVPCGKIHVIPPGVTAVGPPPTTSRPPLPTPASCKVLYVGSIFNRRHVPDLIEAVGHVARAHAEVSFDLVGDNRSHPYQDIAGLIDRQGVGRRMRWHHYMEEDALAELFGSARAFAFLSEYEGLGLTPLEALAAGIPAVLLDSAVARESCGEAALYVPKGDVAATAAALTTLLFDEAVRRRVLAAAPTTLARFDWTRAANETLAVLEGAA